jgi:acylphosphatase
MTPRLHVRITGRVQGVGFRYATVNQATTLGLTGWVRNEPGGGVEAVFEGPRDLLEQVLAWCHHGPALAQVRTVEVRWDETATPHPGFGARH